MILKDLLLRFSPLTLLSRFRLAASLIALLIIIWSLSAWLSFSMRLWLSILVVAAYVGYKVWRIMQNKRQQQKVNQQLARQQQDTGVDLLPLRKNVATAINTLRRSAMGQKNRGTAAIYDLPWYLLLGASGVGKTSLLRNSDLNYPLNSDEELQLKGFTGTKDVDWWFAEQAVILDTAGRYTSNKEDNAEWLGLLHILKRYRWRLPVNGVLLAISLEELLLSDKQQLEQQAAILRERISELNQHLGFVLPINIVITKSDLLSGFAELYNAMQQQEQQQAWGISLQNLTNDENINDSIKQQFAVLQQRLVNYALQHLDTTENTQKKSKAFKFVSQFKSVLQRIEDFIFLVVHDNPYQTKFNLRGVYFTSATQQGLQIEKMVDEGQTRYVHLENVSKEQQSTESKSFFIKDMLCHRIFNDNNSAVMNQRTRMVFNSMKYGLLSLTGIVLLTIMIFWGMAYAYNHRQLKQSVARVGHLRSVMADQQADQWDLLSAQLDVYQQFHLFDQHEHMIAGHNRMGLYRGDDQQANLQKILGVSMQNNFLYPVASEYEHKLKYYERVWPHLNAKRQQKIYFDYYQTLRNYLQLGVYDPNANQADVEAITNAWVAMLAKQKNNDYGSMLNTAQLAHLVQFYLTNQYSGISPDSLAIEWLPKRDLVAVARQQLRRPIDVSLLNTKLQQVLQNEMAPVSISKLLPSDVANIFVDKYQLPSMYTKQAWNSVVANQVQQIANQASAGDWVINQPISINQDDQLKPMIDNTKPDPVVASKLKAEMLATYFKAYLQAWFSWMQQLRIKQFDSLSDASDGLIKLSKSDGPMVELLASIADNLQIKDAQSHWQLFAKDNEAPIIYKTLMGADGIINSDLVDNNTDLVKQYLQAVSDVQTDVENISVSSNQEQAADKYAKAILTGNAGDNKLYQARIAIGHLTENIAQNQTQNAVSSVLLAPLRAAWQAILITAEKQIQTNWQNQVIPAYENEIAGKAPFDNNGPDISMAQIQSFFDPSKGAYWQFVNKQLLPYVNVNGMHWSTNNWLGIGMPLSRNFMESLDQAQNITTTLFGNDSTSPKFYYSLYPIPEPHISQVKLYVNNQHFVYANGPQQWSFYHWAENQSPQQTILSVNKDDGEAQARLYAGGMWSLFKLLSKAHDLRKIGSHYLVHWEIQASDGSTVRIGMRFRTDGPADSVAGFVLHPFKPPYLMQSANGDQS